jgi:DNA polymerase-3 subunit alpha
VFYLTKDMHEAHDALICIGNKTYVNEKNRIKYSPNHYLKNDSEMLDLFSDLPEALENNYNFPYRSSFRPLFSKPILPNISSSDEGNASDIIKKNSLRWSQRKI